MTPQPRVEIPESQTTAGQVKQARLIQAYSSLGIGSSNSTVRTLEDEVDSYLALPSRGEWDCIAFWEV